MRFLLLVALVGAGVYGYLQYAQSSEAPETPGTVDLLRNTGGSPVEVPGSKVKFQSKAQLNLGGSSSELTVTGTALRKKLGFSVYAMASYVADGTAVKTAAELCAAEKLKLLHLVMERKASGKQFTDAFRDAMGKPRAEKEFAKEFAKLDETVGKTSAEVGQSILLISIPEKGLRIIIGTETDVTLENTAFAKAIWETYLGTKPLDETIKKNLLSQAK